MKKIIIAIIIILLILMFIFAIPITNNIMAKEIETKLKTTKLPPQTQIIDSISIAGKLVGNGNGMQYFGAILVKTELSKEELKEYYREKAENEWEYLIEKQTSNKIEVIEHGDYVFKKVKGENLNQCYIIYSWESPKNNLLNLDIRGH